MKQAKLAMTGVLPQLARPPATPTRLLSAMPMLKNRSGCFLPNHSVRVELETSASTTTISGWSAPRASRARPKASRVALPNSRFDCTAEDAPAMSVPLPKGAKRHRIDLGEEVVSRGPIGAATSVGGRRGGTVVFHQGNGLVEILGRERLAVEVHVAQLLQQGQDALSL